MTSRFDGKRVFLTGAASGIGAATLELFQGEGAKVVGVDITATDGLLTCDVSDPNSVEEAVAEAAATLGGLDVVLNVAGTNTFSTFTGLPIDEWQRIIGVNLTGPMLVTKAALPHLRESKGNVVTVASISGVQGQPYLSAYCASKGGLIQLMKSLAVELSDFGIRVNCVSPGGVGLPVPPPAEFADAVLPPGIDASKLSRLNGVLPGTTSQRDVAEAIAYLASDVASAVSGVNLLIDRVTIW